VLVSLLDADGELGPLIEVQVFKVEDFVRRLASPSNAELDHVDAQVLDPGQFVVTPAYVRDGWVAHDADEVLESAGVT
jgi:hypothetical protein